MQFRARGRRAAGGRRSGDRRWDGDEVVLGSGCVGKVNVAQRPRAGLYLDCRPLAPHSRLSDCPLRAEGEGAQRPRRGAPRLFPALRLALAMLYPAVLPDLISTALCWQERRFLGCLEVGCEGALAGGWSETAPASCESLRRLPATFRATAPTTQRSAPLLFSGNSLRLQLTCWCCCLVVVGVPVQRVLSTAVCM
jgi:hypothetical protein